MNFSTCPSKDLSIEDTGWQSNCYKMSAVLCYVIMFVYDYTYLYRYTCILYNHT